MTTPRYEWQKSINGQEYIISNKTEWHSRHFIQDSFDRDEIYWTKSMAPESLKIMLSNCCTLGLYVSKTPDPTSSSDKSAELERTQIGFSRLITDYVTFAYLTDVFILPEHQGIGLGKWLIACTREVIGNMPEFRAALLFTSAGEKGAARFYEKELGMEVFGTPDEGRVLMLLKGKSFIKIEHH